MNPIRQVELVALTSFAEKFPQLIYSFNRLEDAQVMVDLQLTVGNEILPTTASGEEVDCYTVTINVKKMLEFVKDSEGINMWHD